MFFAGTLNAAGFRDEGRARSQPQDLHIHTHRGSGEGLMRSPKPSAGEEHGGLLETFQKVQRSVFGAKRLSSAEQ